MSILDPIAIVGIGCRMPGGVRSPDELWDLLINGVDATGEVPEDRWRLSAMYHPDPNKPGRMYARRGGFVDNIDRFDAQFFGISPREAAAADPQQRLLLEVAYEAVEDAGLTISALSGKRAGVYIGITNYDYSGLHTERAIIDAYTSLGSAQCIAANRISYFFNLVGPSLAIDTACSSSLVAVDLGCQSIWNGTSELAFAGGVNLMVRPETTIAAAKASMLSPDGRCKSFDSRANGFARGEGGAIVILKSLTRALAENDRIYAVIRATAVNQDGRTEGITVPSRAGQEANLRDALRLAQVEPESIQYVEAHGTGTPVGDPIEAAALGAVYGKARESSGPCVIGSIKSNMGHLEAGAGVAGLIKAALCLQHRQIPPNLHFESPNPDIPFDELRLRVAQKLEPWPQTNGHPPRAGVNSFGFGGTNGHAILEAAPATADRPPAKESDDSQAWMLPLSARSASSLPDVARSYLGSLSNERGLKAVSLRDICHSASVKRSHHEHRLTLVAHDKLELAEQLETFLRGEDSVNRSTGRASGEPVRPVFVCSGMGQQWWAMGRELLTREPVYRRAVEEVEELYRPLAGWSLIDKLTADEKSSDVQRTHVAQPAIFATQVGLAALWRSWGIVPAAVFGHSAGEVAASYIAGALSLEDAVCVIFHRSRLLQRTVGQGSMLAAGIPREEAARWVERHPRDISIAAINAANSVTLSGDAAILAEIDKTLNEAGVFSRALQVEAPFHSQKMEQIEAELVESLRDIRPRPASTPFFSTVTGTALVGTEVDGPHWYRNTRQPVLFSDVMKDVLAAGHRLFLEIGAHPVLRYDIAACLKENSTQGTALCSIRRNDRERAAMLGSLGRMHVLGAEIDWQKLHPADARAIKLPLYPFQADSHWREPDHMRRVRMGLSIHPLLGNRQEAPQPAWQVGIDTAGLGYLQDHRVNGAIVFPGAAFVEMALAAARETFGPVPCVLENIEFQKLLFVDEDAASSVQFVLDPASSDFGVYARANASDAWEPHARGYMRESSQPAPASIDLAEIRKRCAEPVDRDDYYRIFADSGLGYGPSFRSKRLWRGDWEALAEIHAPNGEGDEASTYRLHPAVLDACLHSAMAALPASTIAQGTGRELYLPVEIGRVRFHASSSASLFAHTRLKTFTPTEVKADIQLMDEAGNLVAEVEDLVCRQNEHRAQAANSALYEYQWKLASQPANGRARDSQHVPSPGIMAPALREAGKSLQQRLDRHRFQHEFLALSRKAAAAYITRALRELGWTPALGAEMPIDTLADRLGIPQEYHRWLRLVLKQLTAEEMASTAEPHPLWKAAWDQFPECEAEIMIGRVCGEQLAAVLRGDIDPLKVLFPEGALTTAEHLYQDAPTIRVGNLLMQKAVAEMVQRLPKGKTLRILEIGGGTGGMTSFVLPVLPEHCTEYVFTDISPRFLAHAQHKFARYPFVQYRTLDIERDPLEQGFDPHSFDLIVASDVLHATQDLRKTLDRVKQLLGSSGNLLLLELTHPWLYATLIFGLLKGWWLFNDDVREDEPCLPQQKWESLLREEGFGDTLCVADCADADSAPHSIILARGPQLSASASPDLAPDTPKESKTWLLFVDAGRGGRPGAGAELALELRERGDRVIEVAHGAGFNRAGSVFTIRAGQPEDMRRLLSEVGRDESRLAGVVHLWSLDVETTESMASDAFHRAARLGCVCVLQLYQAVAAADGLVVDGIWLVTRAVQSIENRTASLEVAQAPLWGLARVAINEYQNLHCRLVDLTTCSREEIQRLADEMNAPEEMEDEIALHGELKYVHRLVPVSPATLHGMGRQAATEPQPFRIEIQRPGILDTMGARQIVRTPPKPHEIEVEVSAVGLNFKDLMMAMGMLPKDALSVESAGGKLLGIECAGRVVAVGDQVSELAVGDEVLAGGARNLASHLTVDARHVALKPSHLSLEQGSTIPIAYLTAWYSLHTLGRMQRGERVLIHSGTGGVGLAAIQLALHAGAVVFATAGSPEKRALLTALGVPHVMDSRTLAFADEVMKKTGNEGVDLVLNSLAGEAIDKSLSVLRSGGRFIEIGLRDIYQNRKMGMRPLRKNLSLFAVDLTTAFDQRPELRRSLVKELMTWFKDNELRALPHRVFPVTRVADAFRFMAEAKHIGKLVVSIKDAEGLEVAPGSQSVAIKPDGSYLITGGLGGFGLAVAERLVRRGARHVALVGRNAPSPAAQATVDALREKGAEVMICQADIVDREQARRVVSDVQRTMGPLRGVFHSAMVLNDAAMERLTEERMWEVMAPKVLGSWNLHTLTADLPLDLFVLFSSVTSITGNPGQGNYAAGSAFLDALAYYRRARGLPALTVNWGWVGEVGHVASASAEITDRLSRLGMKPMPVFETLRTLEELLSSNAVQAVVAHLDWKEFWRLAGTRVPARFADLAGEANVAEGGAAAGSRVRDILEADAAVLPSLLEIYIRDHLARPMGASPSRIDTQQSLLNLGIDSLIAVEVRNRINDDLGVNISLTKFMQSASISALASQIAERLIEEGRGKPSKAAGHPTVATVEVDVPPAGKDAPDLAASADGPPSGLVEVDPAFQSMVGDVGGPSFEAATAGQRLNSCIVPIQPKGTKTPLFCVHPAGGGVLVYLALARRLGLEQPLYGVQSNPLDPVSATLETVEDMARHYVEAIAEVQETGPYLLAGWSMGGLIAYEMARQFTRRGEKVALLTMVDSFPAREVNQADLTRWLDSTRTTGVLLDEDEIHAAEPVLRRHFRASAGYRPLSYSGPVLLFCATKRDEWSHDDWTPSRNFEFWQGRITGKFEVEAVPGDHFTMMREPGINLITQRLADSVNLAMRGLPQVSSLGQADAV